MGKDSAKLIADAQAGDMDAFAALFEALRPMAFAVASRLIGPDDADDVVMEAYLKAWQALPRFSGRSSLKTWLYRITHNCALDMIRARDRRKERVAQEPAEESGRTLETLPDETARAPDEDTVRAELAGEVREALVRLSREHRLTLEFRFADGLSYAEIAAATGVSIGTVMSRLFNAKRKLRRVLEEMQK